MSTQHLENDPRYDATREIRAPRGPHMVCKTWGAEAAYRMIQNNLDQEVAENPKELVVKSVRGSLQISVEDDVREIPEGEAYRIVLDPNADPQGPRGAGTKGMGGPPIKAAKSRFIWYAVAITGGLTIYVAHEAWESAYKP